MNIQTMDEKKTLHLPVVAYQYNTHRKVAEAKLEMGCHDAGVRKGHDVCVATS